MYVYIHVYINLIYTGLDRVVEDYYKVAIVIYTHTYISENNIMLWSIPIPHDNLYNIIVASQPVIRSLLPWQ